jgi:D-alanyl-D-alanine carboxypeptidase/D-alanyl-D-alanine-endopeptidase (penicillin-binding protein 4)
MTDGSGLSRYNLLTPRATVQLLAAVQRLPGGKALWDALPVAGVNGTLGRRMKGTPAQNNARAKTGTFSIVSTLSGYVTTRDGHRLAVSLLTNFARDGRNARRLQDEVYALLAQTQWSR